MDTRESSASAHPFIEDHELDSEAVEAHYAALERTCACYGGAVYIGHMVEGEDGEEVEVFEAYACRRCAREGI